MPGSKLNQRHTVSRMKREACLTVFLATWLTLLTNPLWAQSHRIDISSTEKVDADRKFEDLSPEEKKEVLKRIILLVSFILAGMFCILLLSALLRGQRRQRRIARLGQKETPTEYVDVWNQHRLDRSETEDPE